MSRSGYSDDCDGAELNLWRGAVKHCELLRQTCPEPMACGNGCQCVKRDAPDLPIVMFDKPFQWLQDLFYTFCYIGGSVVLGALVLVALVFATGLDRVLF